jgi:hypothetical protein
VDFFAKNFFELAQEEGGQSGYSGRNSVTPYNNSRLKAVPVAVHRPPQQQHCQKNGIVHDH